jgi:hypothetical protein
MAVEIDSLPGFNFREEDLGEAKDVVEHIWILIILVHHGA